MNEDLTPLRCIMLIAIALGINALLFGAMISFGVIVLRFWGVNL